MSRFDGDGGVGGDGGGGGGKEGVYLTVAPGAAGELNLEGIEDQMDIQHLAACYRLSE